MTPEEILGQRKNKYLKIGEENFISNPENLSALENETTNIKWLFKDKEYLFLVGSILFRCYFII